ncbi:MAG: hypothetical protein M3296_03230 [Actinomycetota bacterium]|nr:hypothetical protein [Actinomycetota bacterium]
MRVPTRGAVLAGAAAAVTLALPSIAQGATKDVHMGLPSTTQKTFQSRYRATVNDFFPHAVDIHVGDTVRFVPRGFHTVDLPAGPQRPLPLIVATEQAIAGARDEAGQPFWFEGRPQVGVNFLLSRSSFGRTRAYDATHRVQSGLPPRDRPRPMRVRFTRTGSFTYFCDVHPGMRGRVRVHGRRRSIPDARADARTVRRQIARDRRIARSLRRTRVRPGAVDVGLAGRHGVEHLGFLPRTLSLPVGGTLRFEMTPRSFETHTATTGPGDPAQGSGSYLGALSASFRAPVLDARAAYPSEPPGSLSNLTPTLHGNGFWNSGIMDVVAASPAPSSNVVSFRAAGTYEFFCLIHPFMHATVVVR